MKGGLTFPGGVHPPEYKDLTEDCPIQVVPAPSQVVLPLSQHIGTPCRPTVAKGDAVQAGQVVGDADAFVSAPVHSPVAGKVKAVGLVPHAVLGRCQAVTIETDPNAPDGKAPSPQRFGADFNPETYAPEQIRQAARDAGPVSYTHLTLPTNREV